MGTGGEVGSDGGEGGGEGGGFDAFTFPDDAALVRAPPRAAHGMLDSDSKVSLTLTLTLTLYPNPIP